MTPKIQATKEKLNKSGFFQIKNISISKGLALILELGEPVPAMK